MYTEKTMKLLAKGDRMMLSELRYLLQREVGLDDIAMVTDMEVDQLEALRNVWGIKREYVPAEPKKLTGRIGKRKFNPDPQHIETLIAQGARVKEITKAYGIGINTFRAYLLRTEYFRKYGDGAFKDIKNGIMGGSS